MLSMTGYGRAMRELDGRQLTIELKSVNHRFLDLSFRMPRNLMFLEDDARKRIGARLSRGHVDVFMTYRNMRSDARSVTVDKALFDAFYTNEFQEARRLCGSNPEAAAAVHAVKRLGLRTVLATNPIFPAVATESRIRWAGLAPEDFELYTTYENIGYCKPNPDYYREIAGRLGVSPAECLMVGNDAQEDMAAEETGMQVFLLTDCLINRERKDIERYRRGTFRQLMQLVTEELRPCTP